jgi:anti-sigma factor RsiW
MNCRTFNKLLPEYLYGESSIKEREEIQAHIQACSNCRQLLDEMTETVSLLGNKERTHFSKGEMAALRMRVKQVVSGKAQIPVQSTGRSRPGFFSRPLFLPAAGALIAASIVAVLLYNPVETPEYLLPALPDGAEELVTMTETVEEEYESVDELCREMDELQLLFFEEPAPGTEAEIGADNLSLPA